MCSSLWLSCLDFPHDKVAGSSQRPRPQVAAAARFCGRSDHGTLSLRPFEQMCLDLMHPVPLPPVQEQDVERKLFFDTREHTKNLLLGWDAVVLRNCSKRESLQKWRGLETNLSSRWEGVRLPPASGKSPDFPGSSPNFPGSFLANSPRFSHCGT